MWFALQPRSLRVRREKTQNVPSGAPSTKIGAPGDEQENVHMGRRRRVHGNIKDIAGWNAKQSQFCSPLHQAEDNIDTCKYTSRRIQNDSTSHTVRNKHPPSTFGTSTTTNTHVPA